MGFGAKSLIDRRLVVRELKGIGCSWGGRQTDRPYRCFWATHMKVNQINNYKGQKTNISRTSKQTLSAIHIKCSILETTGAFRETMRNQSSGSIVGRVGRWDRQ